MAIDKGVMRRAPLGPWHVHVTRDLHAGEIDKSGWASWVRHEGVIFRDVRRGVVDKASEYWANAFSRAA